MDQQTGWLINLFDFFQPIKDVYCGQFTNENVQFLQHSINEPSVVIFHRCTSAKGLGLLLFKAYYCPSSNRIIFVITLSPNFINQLS